MTTKYIILNLRRTVISRISHDEIIDMACMYIL